MRHVMVIVALIAAGCAGSESMDGSGAADAFVDHWICLPAGLGCVESIDRMMSDTYDLAAAECARTGDNVANNAQWGELWHIEGGPGVVDASFTSPISASNPGGDTWDSDVGGANGALGIFSWKYGTGITGERKAAVRCAHMQDTTTTP